MAGRKSAAEARIERVTWFLLVLMFAMLNIVPDTTRMPNAVVPFIGAFILFGSGLYQYYRGWRVSFITWIAGTLMAVMGAYSVMSRPDINMTPGALIIVAIVILFGVFTNES